MERIFTQTFISYFIAIFPWFVIGIIVALVLERLLHPRDLNKYFSTFSYRKVIVADLLGMISPLSIMSFLPVANEFVSLGANPGLLFSFVVAERAYDLQSFFIISSLFGTRVAILNAVAILISLIVTTLVLKRSAVKFVHSEAKQQKSFWLRQLKLVLTVLIGVLIGSALRVLIPRQIFQDIAGDPIGGTISALVIGFSLYFGPVIGNYPVAKSFADLGMAPVGLLTFLTVTPIFNFVIIMLFSTLVGVRETLKMVSVYTLTALTLSVLFGLLL